MGKTRRNRARPSRKDPIQKTVKPPSDPELAALREKSILPVIRDLQSSDPKARTAAASAVANLVEDARCRKLLLRERVVHIVLCETLTDSALESRAAGWEILRVLAEEEEADFCIHLYRQDVLTALDFAAKSALESLASKEGKLTKAELKVVWNIIGSLVALTSTLSEADDEILETVVGREYILTLLLTVIASSESPASIRLDALSCLMTLAEDNRPVVELVIADQDPKPFTALLQLQDSRGVGRVLVCGVLHNVFSAMKWCEGSPGSRQLSDATLVRTLSEELQVTVSDGDKGSDELPENSQWSKQTEVLQLALEILASIGTTLQESMANSHARDEEEWGGIEDDDAMDEDKDAGDDDTKDEEADDSKVEDEMDEDDIADIQADMAMVTGADDDEDESSSEDLSTLRELVQRAIPEIIRMINLSAQKAEYVPLQAPALSALNNMAWSVSCFDFSVDENASILKVWEPAGRSIWENVVGAVLASNTADVELASTVTSLAWAVSRTLPGGRLQLEGGEHNKFISLYHAARKLDQKAQKAQKGSSTDGQGQNAPTKDGDEEDPFQGLGVKCIGVLGQLALHPAPVSLNREVGVFLLTLLSGLPETPVADVVEVLNQLFDIYGDEEYAQDKEVFWKDNFLEHLEQALPQVKAAVKKVDKRTNLELRSRGDEAVLNLGRFIQYKKKHKP
ncbi:hypothetical protein SODALDRAFT_325996 [Sodiomyces alkalinus F11]|uniref:SYO1-like TPR repeats domain-containing protein n=1 Tax=Sodiomyces alkalinus (strain CBS 110278 / VKM F-3762 / F11) TaxID=1314773 RepID=A0A3N2Q4X5_SODAK|nr:hypothetical protein SODALDRAFT_325996 [Sodiomyces alkalinus F11]ROT41812.1 hypothetical protein SODALDRAFT_325996 [Sodiomyces alkalinus F11]